MRGVAAAAEAGGANGAEGGRLMFEFDATSEVPLNRLREVTRVTEVVIHAPSGTRTLVIPEPY